MKRLFSAAAVCALAVGLTAAPGAVAKKGPKSPKQVYGKVSVFVSAGSFGMMMASGNVKSNSSCRKDRDVLLGVQGALSTQWVNKMTGATAPTGLVGTVETRSNGDYSTPVMAPPAGTWVLQAFVDDEYRKVGSKKKGKRYKKGRKFHCMELTGPEPDRGASVTVL